MSAQRIQPLPRLTPDAYLAFERASEVKHEYHDGIITLQAGSSSPHARLTARLTGMVYRELNGRRCTLYSSDMRVTLPNRRSYLYPDLIVACGETAYEDSRQDTLTTPTLIIEVLSPSTERYDRGKKFKAYQTIPSFQEYLLVAQDVVLIEHYTRLAESLWSFEVITERGALITLSSIGCALSVAEIYESVVAEDLPEDPPPADEPPAANQPAPTS